MKIYIETYGCVANQDNANIIKGILKGYNFTNNPKQADIVIINTCTVVQTTEKRMLSRISKYKNKKTIVTGCLATQKELIKKTNPKASIINTHNISKIKQALKKQVELTNKTKENKAKLPKIQNKDYGICQISTGCKGKCSYCITKLEKGDIYSFPVKDIISNIKESIKQGKKTIYLTSQDNGAYGLDKHNQSQLPNLLKEILKINKDFKLRIGMMNPQHVLPTLKELISIYKNKKIIKFIHIPVQAGSNKVLKTMNREYKIKDFKKIVKKFRKKIPDLSISTDIIVGYPTETEKDFKKTLKLIKKIKPEVLNISRFASRPKTKAAKLKPLSTKITKRRSLELTNLFNKL